MDCDISGNGRDGVTIDGNVVGNAILSNVIFANAGKGISLQNGGNAGQPAPKDVVAAFAPLPSGRVFITGHLKPYSDDYKGTYQIQVFVAPSSDGPTALLATQSDIAVGDFTLTIDVGSQQVVGSYLTVTATPTTGPANTSEFSAPAKING